MEQPTKKQLQQLLIVRNSKGVCTAVAFKCPHHRDKYGIVMSLETAFKHFLDEGCRAWMMTDKLDKLAFCIGPATGALNSQTEREQA